MDAGDVILSVHLASLGLAAFGVVKADMLAYTWLRGRSQALDSVIIGRIHITVAIGLWGLVATGLYMFWPMRAYLLGQPLFLLKLFFVVCLVINSFLLGRVMHVATRVSFANLKKSQKLLLLLSGCISVFSWCGAGIAALVFFGL